MKYGSWTWTFAPRAPRNIPVSPPTMNRKMKVRANSMGDSKVRDPLYIVAIQLKTLTAGGMATEKVRREKMIAAVPDMPVTNMWCPQTKNPKTAIASDESAMALYPKSGFREKTGTTSDVTPIAGRGV